MYRAHSEIAFRSSAAWQFPSSEKLLHRPSSLIILLCDIWRPHLRNGESSTFRCSGWCGNSNPSQRFLPALLLDVDSRVLQGTSSHVVHILDSESEKPVPGCSLVPWLLSISGSGDGSKGVQGSYGVSLISARTFVPDHHHRPLECPA